MYDYEDRSVNKVKRCQVNIQKKITSVITPYQLVGEIQRIEEALWEHNKKSKNCLLAGLHDRMCFLMAKYGILRGKSLFSCELSYYWYFMKTDEEPHPLHYVAMEIFQG